MKYDPRQNALVIPTRNAASAADYMRYCIRKIRQTAGLPLEGYPNNVLLTDAMHAELAVLGAANALGIDLGAERNGKLDVRDAN